MCVFACFVRASRRLHAVPMSLVYVWGAKTVPHDALGLQTAGAAGRPTVGLTDAAAVLMFSLTQSNTAETIPIECLCAD
jgi:hypothetical protein